MTVAAELEKLKALRDAGDLSEAEFETAKARVLAGATAAPAEGGGVSRALWALVIVVVVAAGAALVIVDGLSRSLELIAGCLGILAAAAGAVLNVMEDASIAGIAGFCAVGIAVAAVVFAGLAPVLIVAALVLLPIGLLWGWISGLME